MPGEGLPDQLRGIEESVSFERQKDTPQAQMLIFLGAPTFDVVGEAPWQGNIFYIFWKMLFIGTSGLEKKC